MALNCCFLADVQPDFKLCLVAMEEHLSAQPSFRTCRGTLRGRLLESFLFTDSHIFLPPVSKQRGAASQLQSQELKEEGTSAK